MFVKVKFKPSKMSALYQTFIYLIQGTFCKTGQKYFFLFEFFFVEIIKIETLYFYMKHVNFKLTCREK